MRGGAIIELLRNLLPEFAVPIFGAITYLGDVATFFVALTLLYWFGDRRRGAYAIAVVLGGLALTLALKFFFALPRPPVELHATVADGYGFPSGHALGSTVFWGALAVISSVSTWRRRAGAAAVVVALVALSRVVLGVHYAADVVVGVAVGLVYLAAVLWTTDDRPLPVFGVAVVLAALAVLASLRAPGVLPADGATCLAGLCTARDAVALLGATLGGSIAWTALELPDRWPARTQDYVVAAVGMPALGVVWLLSYTTDVPLVVTLLVNAGVFASILALPALAART